MKNSFRVGDVVKVSNWLGSDEWYGPPILTVVSIQDVSYPIKCRSTDGIAFVFTSKELSIATESEIIEAKLLGQI